MKKIFVTIMALCASVALNTQAFTIELAADYSQVNSGDSILLNVNVNGLNDLTAPSLGAYDVNLQFNPSLVNVAAINWGDAIKGNQLDLAGFGSLQDSVYSGAGVLNLVELSFDSAWDLDTLQAGSFTLFSILFSTSSFGTADFSLSVNALGDASGNALEVDAINSTSVTINSVQLPEPSALLLLMAGLALVMLRVRATSK